jgi:hypothetical protein
MFESVPGTCFLVGIVCAAVLIDIGTLTVLCAASYPWLPQYLHSTPNGLLAGHPYVLLRVVFLSFKVGNLHHRKPWQAKTQSYLLYLSATACFFQAGCCVSASAVRRYMDMVSVAER